MPLSTWMLLNHMTGCLNNEIEKLVHAIPHTEATNYNTTLPQNLLKRHADHLKDIPEVKALLYVKKKKMSTHYT